MINAPNSTAAVGALYNHEQWRASLTYKYSGDYVAGYNGTHGIRLPGYDTFDGSIAYDFGHYAIKLQGSNLLDKRAITNFTGSTLYSTTDTGLYNLPVRPPVDGDPVGQVLRSQSIGIAKEAACEGRLLFCRV